MLSSRNLILPDNFKGADCLSYCIFDVNDYLFFILVFKGFNSIDNLNWKGEYHETH
jgi:hypothetical protein